MWGRRWRGVRNRRRPRRGARTRGRRRWTRSRRSCPVGERSGASRSAFTSLCAECETDNARSGAITKRGYVPRRVASQPSGAAGTTPVRPTRARHRRVRCGSCEYDVFAPRCWRRRGRRRSGVQARARRTKPCRRWDGWTWPRTDGEPPRRAGRRRRSWLSDASLRDANARSGGTLGCARSGEAASRDVRASERRTECERQDGRQSTLSQVAGAGASRETGHFQAFYPNEP